jgi:hypothetical protein
MMMIIIIAIIIIIIIIISIIIIIYHVQYILPSKVYVQYILPSIPYTPLWSSTILRQALWSHAPTQNKSCAPCNIVTNHIPILSYIHLAFVSRFFMSSTIFPQKNTRSTPKKKLLPSRVRRTRPK